MDSLLTDQNKYLLSVVFDNFASSLMAFSIPLYVLGLTSSGLYLSLLSALTILPFLVLGLPFGALVDKLALRRLLYISDLLRCCLYLLLFLVIFYTNSVAIRLWILILVTVCVSCINVISSISETTYLSELFKGSADFTALNSKVYSIQYMLGIVAPIFGGLVYSEDSIGILLLMSSLCYLLSSCSFYFIRSVENPLNSQFSSEILKGLLVDVAEGYRYVSSKKTVFLPLVITAVFNILTANFQNDSLIFLKNIVNLDTEQLGFFVSIATGGALSGAFLIKFLKKRYSFSQLFIGNMLLQSILRMLYPQWNSLYWLAIFTFVIDALQSILNIGIITNRQELVEQKYLGRATSLYKTVLIGVNSLGFMIGGFVTENLGVRVALLISGIGLAVLSSTAFLLYRGVEK